ncbi:MAG: S41 family peptidase [bacterium]|nr:S41 family peptidase [bacterium]
MESGHLKRRFFLKGILGFLSLSLTLLVGLTGGWFLGYRGYQIKVERERPKITLDKKEAPYGQDQTVDFSLFWKAWDILNKDYLFQPLDAQKLVYGAISGLAQATGDPFTAFLPPEEHKMVADSLNGQYEGVGAELAVRQGNLIIIAPLDGSPAKAAGIRPGDVILQVNDQPVAGLTLSEAVAKIRGPAGSEVVLTLQRDTKEPFTVKIIRAKLTQASVKWHPVEGHSELAYLRLSRFGETTEEEWNRAVEEIKAANPAIRGIVLDLRGDPGGFVEGAVWAAGEFLPAKSTVLFEEFNDGSLRALRSERQGRLQNLPVVVLINKGSASSSEIVAGALREGIGAKLVGETSFGKGTVQKAESFADGSGLHVTIAKWLTPGKTWVHDKGLDPDVKLEVDWEKVEDGQDPQLDKAIEILREEL